ncbi:DMT family transporter [Luteolibacter flavescens]|uniref:DMT family transporter n=1 Tax=Luteolibacter flavescens TaxID=1859460 RepID=A0ABT3FNR6_9BACT|nr:DMT family transporter [Luteolibacter flavescens]MCW1885221.1 DMT family transporter [Luteolibacter flavescens]
MKPPDAHDPRGLALMLLSVFLFAANTLLLRALSLHLPAADGWMGALYRGTVGMLMVAALYGFGRGLSVRALLGSKLVALRGIVGALSIAAFYLTIAELGASRAVVLNLTYPIFATLIAAWWLKERVSRSALLWMLAGFAGLLLFVGGDATRGITAWDGIALAGALGAGIVVVLIRKLRATEHAGTIYASQCFYSILLALPIRGAEVGKLPPHAHLWLILAAIIVGVSQLVMTNAYRTMPVSRGSSIQMLLPLVTAAGAYFLFGERFTALELGGAALTLFATWRVAAAPKRRPEPANPFPDPANTAQFPDLPKP